MACMVASLVGGSNRRSRKRCQQEELTKLAMYNVREATKVSFVRREAWHGR